MSVENPQFLHKKYQDLNSSVEVESAARRTKVRAEDNDAFEEISQKPSDRIQNYLDRFREIIDRPDEAKRERGIEALKTALHEKLIIKPTDVPEAAFLLEQRIARDLGHGTVELSDEFRQRKTAQIISDQEHSLDKWIDYLASPNADYPDWAKYWAFRSMTEMGKLEKQYDEAHDQETARFAKRTKDTVSAFPPMNPRALAMAIGAMKVKLEQKQKPKAERELVPNSSTKLEDRDFQTLLSTEDFSKLYTQFLIEIPEYSREGLQETRGQWVKYSQESDAASLVASLDGYPLEWCTANIETAQNQLESGDVYVYYSLNEDGEPKIPRVAIRMEQDKIAEVRGIAPDQEADPYIADVIAAKLPDFGSTEAERYSKRVADMKYMTNIETAITQRKPLTKPDLIFLYEVDSQIEGFAHNNVRDTRIAEFRATRNPQEDAPMVLDCNPDEIAWKPEDVTESTKAYIGPLFPSIFQFPLEHIYTSFPDGKVELFQAEIGGKTKDELIKELKAEERINLPDDTKLLLESKDFTTFPQSEQIDLVKLSVASLGFDQGATTEQVYQRAKELGLDLCPAEVGPHLRLQDLKQKMNSWYRIAMKQITDRDGYQDMFVLNRPGSGLWLGDYWAMPDYRRSPDDRLVFRRRSTKHGESESEV